MGIIMEGGFYRNVFNVASLRDALLYVLIVTALRLTACTVFLRDVAISRHSSNKFGSALDFRNVIKSLTPSG